MAERKIAGMEIKVDRPLATVALHLQARLAKAAGGNIHGLFSVGAKAMSSWAVTKTLDDQASDAEKNAAKAVLAEVGGEFISAVAAIFERLSPEDYVSLVRDVLSLGKLKRPSGQYDTLDLDGDFSMNLAAIIPVVAFILKEVFGDFFSGALGSGGRGTAGTA